MSETKRGRKPLPQMEKVGPEFVGQTPPEDAALERAERMAERMTDDILGDVLEAGMDLGRLQAMDFIATVANSASIQIFERVKKSKVWMKLKNCDGRTFESLDEFCKEKLGKSYRRMQELSVNYHMLGQEAFEQAERIGLRQADFNLLKKLPAPKQEIIKEALKEGQSAEAVRQALRELAAADQAEIEALKQEAQAKEAQLEAERERRESLERILEDKNRKLDELDAQLHGIRRDPELAEGHLRELLEQETQRATAALMPLRSAIVALLDHFGDRKEPVPERVVLALEAALGQVMTECRAIAHDLGIGVAEAGGVLHQASGDEDRAIWDKTLADFDQEEAQE